ncbi:MAG: hypothetical protein Roseis2KO_15120 [Roseivirga sp.]
MHVMEGLYNKLLRKKNGYVHYEAVQGLFYNRVARHSLISTNGFAIDPSHFESDYRISRFVRDPRDLIVSGYFYHLKGSEPWFRFKTPSTSYWSAINACVPHEMPSGLSYQEYLSGLSLEDGLLAEMEFRKYHLESLRHWETGPKIRVWKYEDILGNEEQVFRELFDFYEVSAIEKWLGVQLAKRYAYSGTKSLVKHIRNPVPGQWRGVFTEKVEEAFNRDYADLLDSLGYEK